MGMQEAVSTCLSKYVVFEGRAARPEYWWWVLAVFIVQLILTVVLSAIFGSDSTAAEAIPGLVQLALLLPSLAVGVRRLHDTDHSGWWLLIGFIPVIGTIWLLVYLVSAGTPGTNRFGDGAAQS